MCVSVCMSGIPGNQGPNAKGEKGEPGGQGKGLSVHNYLMNKNSTL